MSSNLVRAWPRTRAVVAAFDELDVCDSTNAFLLARPKPEPFSAVVSWNQTNGVGRHGRRWISAPNSSLAISLFFPVSEGAATEVLEERASWIPLLAGVAAVEALNESVSASFALKWPNDVLFDERKVAGILTQVHPSGGYVIGLGLNVYRLETAPVTNAISLVELADVPLDFDDLFVASFILRLQERVALNASQFPDIVKEFLDTLGRVVNVEEIGKKPWVGKALGLGPRGELMVMNEEGIAIQVQAADVWHLRVTDVR